MSQSGDGPDTSLPKVALLCLEGYPRSANSTLAWEIVGLNRNLYIDKEKFRHHSHDRTVIRKAIIEKVPTFVLIRQPLDAIISYQIYSEEPIGRCVQKWIDFYSSIRGLSNRFTLVEFDDVTRNPKGMARAILSRSGLGVDFDPEHVNLVSEEKKRLRSLNFRKTIEPDKTRSAEKIRIVQGLPSSVFAGAMQVYKSYHRQPRLLPAEL